LPTLPEASAFRERWHRIAARAEGFSPDEDAVLANWLRVRPPKVAKGIEPDEAIARMGFETEPHHYRLVDAVVASIVLENVEKRLPAWSA
jgi:hypothetical protein